MARLFTVATFNVNSLRPRLPIVLDWLARRQPDALCLQETKVQDRDFPVRDLAAAGYQAVFRGEKSYNGVALLSRQPAADMLYGLDDGGPPDESRLLSARVGPLWIVNTYVPQGRDLEHAMFAYKLAWFRRLRAWFDRHFTPRSPLVWVGDLNVAPLPIDIHNAAAQANHVCYHVSVREAFAAVMAWGFTDVFRRHRPGPGEYSYFDYRTPRALQRHLGWRVDHILATRTLAEKSMAAAIDLEPRRQPSPSDHTVMAATFRL